MLKSKLQFFVSFLTFCLFIVTLVFSIQEADHYIDDEKKLWESESWNFWPKK